MNETEVTQIATPREAVFAFGAWLTSRGPESGPFGAHHNASPMAELLRDFCQSQGWTEIDPRYPDKLKDYPD